MRSIDKDEVFLEHYYKCYNKLRIFIVSAIQAAENLAFQEEDNRNRIVVAEKKEKTASAREQRYIELSTKTGSTETDEDSAHSDDVVFESLHEEAKHAIDILIQARQDQWHVLIQDILDGKAGNTKISQEEAELLSHQFGGRDKITVSGLLSAIKDNMTAMVQRAKQGIICRNDSEPEKERARSFKRWLRWNTVKIQQEIDFLLYVENHFGASVEMEDLFTHLMDDVKHHIAVPTNPPKYNEVKQNMRLLSSRGVFKTSFVSQSTRDKNKKLLETAIAGLSILIDNIVAEEDFSWYTLIQDELLELKKNLINHKSVIRNTYNLHSHLDALEKSFSALDEALIKDEELKQNINEHFDTESAHRLAEEMMTQFRALKNHLKALREQLDEYAIVRFFKNIFSAIYNWRKTGTLVLKWMRANPLTTVGIGVLILALVGLTAFAPYASLPLVLAFGVTVATGDAIATAGVVIGAVALGAVVASSTAGAGSLIKIEQRNKMSKLEQEVENAEERANEAERRANAAEAAYRRKKLEGYTSEKEAIDDEEKVLLAQMEALREKRNALSAHAKLDTAKAQEMERAALSTNPTSQEVTRVNLQTEEDNLDSLIDSLETSVTQNTFKQVELTGRREKILSDIAKQRQEAANRASLEPDEASHSHDNEEIIHTRIPSVPDMTTSVQALRSKSIFEPNEDTKLGDTVFNQLLPGNFVHQPDTAFAPGKK